MPAQEEVRKLYWDHAFNSSNGEIVFVNNTDEIFRASGATSYPKFLKFVGPYSWTHPCHKCDSQASFSVTSRSKLSQLVRRLRYAITLCASCEEKRRAGRPTPKEISKAYWKGTMDEQGVISWENDFAEYLNEHGLDYADDVAPHLGSCDFTGPCGRCGKTGFKYSANTRKALEDKAHRVFVEKDGRCDDCFALDKADEKNQQLAQEQQEKEAALAKRESRRPAMMLKHGQLFTGIECPECDAGFLVVKLNSTQMKPFLSCSTFNPYKSSTCSYTQNLAPEFHEEYLDIFRARLMQKTA